MIVAPRLRAAAPGAEPHRIHHAATAAPVAARVELEALRRLERLLARVLVLDVAPAPGTERRRIGHHPTAVGAFRARLAVDVFPLEPPTAAGAVAPEAIQLGVAAGAPQLGGGYIASAQRAIDSSTIS